MSDLIKKLEKDSNSTKIEFNTNIGPVKALVALGEGLSKEDYLQEKTIEEVSDEIEKSDYNSIIYISKLKQNNYPFITEYNEKGVTIKNSKSFEKTDPNMFRGFKELLLKRNPEVYEKAFGKPKNECRYIN